MKKIILIILINLFILNNLYASINPIELYIKDNINIVANYSGINAKYLNAIAKVESNYYPLAVNINQLKDKEFYKKEFKKFIDEIKKYYNDLKIYINKKLYSINEINFNKLPDKFNVSIASISIKFNSLKEAKSFVNNIIPIYDNIDIGLFQINYRVWSKISKINPANLFDVLTSSYIASYILLYNYRYCHSIKDAIKLYHSWNNNLNSIYINKINKVLLAEED